MIISGFDGVENIVGKGENAVCQHFLLFPQCFQKASFPDASKGVIVWEWVKPKYQITNNETLDRSKIKALADDKLIMVEFVTERLENGVGKK